MFLAMQVEVPEVAMIIWQVLLHMSLAYVSKSIYHHTEYERVYLLKVCSKFIGGIERNCTAPPINLRTYWQK